MRLVPVVGALVALVYSSQAVAQAAGSSSNPSPRFGLIAGINLAKLSGTDVEGAENRTGFMGGALVSLPVSRDVAVQPEILFTMKGATTSNAAVSGAAKLNYVEVPLLFRLDVPASGGVKPFAYAGPAFALQLSCDLEARSGGATVSLSCDDATRQSGTQTVTFASTDVGAVIGGGLAFEVGARVLSIGVRYDVGFTKIASGSDAKNRVLSFVGTFEWPFRR